MIIRSKAENDVYKWNMSYLIMRLFPNLEVEFKFQNRKKGEKFDQDFVDAIKLEIQKLDFLALNDNEKEFMKRKFWWIPGWYFDWYQSARIFNPDYYTVELDENGELVMLAKGPGYIITFSETVLLPIFSELRARYFGADIRVNQKEAEEKLIEQIELSNQNQLLFSEFGLRRRFSSNWHDRVDDIIKERAKYCVGNSNVYEAFRCDTGISGTQAHEIYMIYNALYGYRQGNYMCVEDWLKTFNGHIGILLGDTIGIDAFLGQLTTLHAKACDGFRHDSGPWETFTGKVVKKLQELHVDPKTKSVIYSNSINMFDLLDITNNVRGRFGTVAGGIGGALTNNTGIENANPNCVMKVSRVRFDKNSSWIDCVKCPDEAGKNMGAKIEVDYCLHTTGR